MSAVDPENALHSRTGGTGVPPVSSGPEVTHRRDACATQGVAPLPTDPFPPGTPSSPDVADDHSRASNIELSALFVVLCCATLRALTTFEPLPYWSTDPALFYAPLTGLGPTTSLFVDAVMLLAAGVGFFASVRLGRVAPAWQSLCIGVGCGAVAFHAVFHQHLNLDNATIGASWSAALVAGLFVATAAQRDRARTIVIAAAIGLIAMLAVKGGIQVFSEHAATVRQYRQNPEQWLAAQGWSPGSSMARAFERRLMQPEATGWFGLANVYASFAAALAALLTVWTAALWLRARRTIASSSRWLITLAAAAAIFALVLAGSKGAYAAAAAGLGIGAVFTVINLAAANSSRERLFALARRAAPFLGILLVAGALAAILLRGIIGERLGELSILFRSFYIQGSIRIIAENPLLGVGPAGFKDAYLVAKPPLSPEEVSSPHSIFFDWLSTLGLAGAAWIAVLIAWITNAGRALVSHATDRSSGRSVLPIDACSAHTRIDLRLIFLIGAATTIIATFLESQAANPDAALARLLGLIAFALVGITTLRLINALKHADPKLHAALIAVVGIPALVLAAHAQIEMTPVITGSAAWFFILAAVAGGRPSSAARSHDAKVGGTGVSPVPNGPGVTHRRDARATDTADALSAIPTAAPPVGAPILSFIPVIVAGCCALWIISAAARIAPWQSRLAAAAELLAPFGEFNVRAAALQRAGQTPQTGRSQDSWDLIAQDAAADGLIPPSLRDPRAIMQAISQAWPTRIAKAADELDRANALGIPHLSITRSLGRLRLAQAAAAGTPDQQSAFIAEAISTAEVFTTRFPNRAGGHANLGILLANAPATDDQRRANITRAIAAWSRAAQLDPYSTFHPMQMADAAASIGDTVNAANFAKRVLDLDALARLDPLKQLSESDRNRMQRLAQSPPATPPANPGGS
jgi:hypothetical protein